MKIIFDLLSNVGGEFLLTAYSPNKFLAERYDLFRGIKFNDEEKLKLFQLDVEGAIYSQNKFSPVFLKKLDDSGVGFFAFKYALKDKKLKYALVLKSMRKINPKYILLQ